MKAAVTDGKGKVWLEEVPMPTPGQYQCLCQMLACATCTGTDFKHIHDKLPWEQKYPGLLGHESIGRVTEIGPKVKSFGVGDLVLRPTPVYPGETFAGYSSMWGGFAEYGLVTDVQALMADEPEATPNSYARFQLAVPDLPGITPGDWSMIITLKETAGYIESVGVRLYKSLVILGAGAVGISMCRHAKIFGAYPVIMVARRDEQLAYARDVIGADFVINSTCEDVVERVREITSGGADILVDTTGNLEFMAACLPALGSDGKAAGYATYPRGDGVAGHIGADRLVTGRTGEDTTHQYLIDCVRLGLLDLKAFYSHVMPLSEISRGFEMLEKKEAFKIVFEMET